MSRVQALHGKNFIMGKQNIWFKFKKIIITIKIKREGERANEGETERQRGRDRKIEPYRKREEKGERKREQDGFVYIVFSYTCFAKWKWKWNRDSLGYVRKRCVHNKTNSICLHCTWTTDALLLSMVHMTSVMGWYSLWVYVWCLCGNVFCFCCRWRKPEANAMNDMWTF